MSEEPEHQDVDRYSWLQAIFSERGPSTYTERSLLGVIFAYTNAKRRSAWPSQQTIGQRMSTPEHPTGLSKRHMIRLLDKLEREGWIRRERKGRHDVYWPTLPSTHETVGRPWEENATDFNGRKGAVQMAPIENGKGDTQKSPITNTTGDTQMAPMGARNGHVIGDIENRIGDIQRPRKVTSRWHPNPQRIHQSEEGVCDTSPSLEVRAERIRKAIATSPGSTNEHLAKLACVSPQEVQHERLRLTQAGYSNVGTNHRDPSPESTR